MLQMVPQDNDSEIGGDFQIIHSPSWHITRDVTDRHVLVMFSKQRKERLEFLFSSLLL